MLRVVEFSNEIREIIEIGCVIDKRKSCEARASEVGRKTDARTKTCAGGRIRGRRNEQTHGETHCPSDGHSIGWMSGAYIVFANANTGHAYYVGA